MIPEGARFIPSNGINFLSVKYDFLKPISYYLISVACRILVVRNRDPFVKKKPPKQYTQYI